VQLEFEMKTKNIKMEINEVYAKLKAAQFEKRELEESLGQKEQLVEELEKTVNEMSQQLEEVHQLYGALNRWFQPTLNGIEERMGKKLETLEQGQSKINERMLQIVQRMYELYEGPTLLELIKRRLKVYLNQRAGTNGAKS
jgi:chromosome segregation ATPase